MTAPRLTAPHRAATAPGAVSGPRFRRSAGRQLGRDRNDYAGRSAIDRADRAAIYSGGAVEPRVFAGQRGVGKRLRRAQSRAYRSSTVTMAAEEEKGRR